MQSDVTGEKKLIQNLIDKKKNGGDFQFQGATSQRIFVLLFVISMIPLPLT